MDFFEPKEIKLWNKQHYVENKTYNPACLIHAVYIYTHTQWIYRDVFLCAFVYANTDHENIAKGTCEPQEHVIKL